MTANQVAYWQLQESKRHNTISEETEKGKLRSQAARWQDQSRIEAGKLKVDEGNLSVNQRRADIAAREADIKDTANAINAAGKIIDVGKAVSMFI